MTTQQIPFRFGVVSMQAPAGTSWIEHARRVEGLGYDTLVMPDNMGHGLAVFPALAAAAAATTTLRLGTYVLANDLRHPVMVAREAATLAALCGNRFELGIGAGRPGVEADYAMIGRPFDRAGVRVDRLTESVGLIKRLVAGEQVTHEGDHYAVTDASVLPSGIDVRVPILIAGRGPRMLGLAGAEADIVALGVPLDATADDLTDSIARVRASGRHVELNLNLMAVGDAMPRFFGGRIDPRALAEAGSVSVVTGSPDQMAEQLHERRERLGISYVLVADELMDAFAPVVDALQR